MAIITNSNNNDDKDIDKVINEPAKKKVRGGKDTYYPAGMDDDSIEEKRDKEREQMKQEYKRMRQEKVRGENSYKQKGG